MSSIADDTRIASRTVLFHESVDITRVPSDIAWIREGTGMVAGGVLASFDPGTGPGRFERASAWFKQMVSKIEVLDEVDAPGTGPVAFGAFTFDEQAPGSLLVIPAWVIGTTEDARWMTSTGPDQMRAPRMIEPIESAELKITGSDQGFLDAVREAKRLIEQGALHKVVLARSVEVVSDRPFDPVRLINYLSSAFPGCFTFRHSDLVGASPELLVRRLGGWVDSIPLAGSIRRGITVEEDDALGKALLASPKDRWEHSLAVDTVTDKLSPLTEGLTVEKDPFLYLLPNVQHLGTKIQGRCGSDIDVLELAGKLHPTAAVCGVPETKAMESIRSLEQGPRGLYAGPVGWVDQRGDGEFAIALRCATLSDHMARVHAGAGIVSDSDPYSELAETDLKLQAMLSALRSA